MMLARKAATSCDDLRSERISGDRVVPTVVQIPATPRDTGVAVPVVDSDVTDTKVTKASSTRARKGKGTRGILASDADLYMLFGDFSEFYEAHAAFVDACVSAWDAGKDLFGLILEHAELMSRFEFVFARNLHVARRFIAIESSQNKEFRSFLRRVEFTPQSSRLDLASLLSKVPGRVAYYRLMAGRFIKASAEGGASSGLAEAKRVAAALDSILARIDDVTMVADDTEMLSSAVELMRLQMADPAVGTVVDFVKPGRNILCHSQVFVLEEKRRRGICILCSDICAIGLCEKDSGRISPFVITTVLRTSDLTASVRGDGGEVDIVLNDGFGAVHIMCNTEADVRHWRKYLKPYSADASYPSQ